MKTNKKFIILVSLLLFFLTFIPTVSAFPDTSVSISPTLGYAPLNVTFRAINTESITSFTWYFGDGNSSTTQNMSQVNTSHVYTQPGSYSPSVSWDCGGYRFGGGGYLIIVYPTADFSASQTSGDAPLTVKFKDTSTGSPVSWSWNFGDGTSSYEQNPVHTYYAAGYYTVILAVRYASNDIEIKFRYIVVNTPTPLVAAFTASSTSGKHPLNVKFTDKSTGSPTSWSWNFGDKSTSTVRSPTHKYTKAGKYTVKLTIKNAAGSNAKTMTITVK